MIAYHEVNRESVSAILRQGLKRTSRGDKGDDRLIYKTDYFLDERRPESLLRQGVSRDDNVYAYIRTDAHEVVDIVDGQLIDEVAFIRNSRQCVLQLTLDKTRCFVSDLDIYDQLKAAVADGHNVANQERLARAYWDSLVRFDAYNHENTKRTELMVTYDIDPSDIKAVN